MERVLFEYYKFFEECGSHLDHNRRTKQLKTPETSLTMVNKNIYHKIVTLSFSSTETKRN